MIPSTFFALVVALSSAVAVNGAVVQRDGTFTYTTPQPTAPGQATTTTTTSATSSQSSSVTYPTTSATTSSTSATASATTYPTTTQSTASGTPPVKTTTSTSPTSLATITYPTTTQTFSIPTSLTATFVTSPTSLPVTASQTAVPAGTANCNGIQQWQASFAYTAGNQVIFNGQLFTATQWTYNNAPNTHPDQWIAGGLCGQPVNNQANCKGVAAWQSTVAYTAGNRVTFNGHLWSAVQWTESNTPGDTSGSWKDLGACA